ncbi:MAG: multifunctional CCA tRNA nucleotidyl transferase/2'3'-cyclic phosphodiesterase/2'nucleotidase/phosphatase [Acetobacter sp.]|nr:multifunctional CCA tRNA nucleotidyl transferase/2'3'-cyclic phosphodiesterase/2'nucleotidase/phosphatase [Acetobacter sp.]
MQIYQVGGAVRDSLLDKPYHDKDYVVIGATEEEMLALGYKKVGKTFPVFLHPESGEEYALARKEIKTGNKHCDFEFIFTPNITLEEDSCRRDFTCNAIYKDIATGEIIDYHKGKEDIEKRVLRHVSEHFSEDPLRVLRMCRFAAQLDFSVAPETMKLCQQMVQNGALKYLSRDRIWQEFAKALSSPSFYKFIETARECGVLKEILPEVEQLWQIPERTDYHPEGNSGAHTMLALKAAQSSDAVVNFTVLLHDIGKTQTNPECWPSHRGHDKLGAELIMKIATRLKTPTFYAEFASFTTAHHMLYHRPLPNIMQELAEVAIVLAKQEQWEYFRRYTDVLKADMQGRQKDDFTEEFQEFEKFENYLQRLMTTARQYNVSAIPEFEEILAKVQSGILPPTALQKAHITFILTQAPL